MHLQQTKRASAETGGPQYYFHSVSKSVRTFLRSQGAVRVALITPYGATKSDFIAVGKDHKLDKSQNAVAGSVGHDRIQQGSAAESIGEAIRRWYKLRNGQFERIDIEIDVIDDTFYLRPIRCKYAGSVKSPEIAKVERPLTFTLDYMSPFWRRQIESVRKASPDLVAWSIREIDRVLRDHHPTKLPHIQEPDLLRASGPLHHFGFVLGGYVGKGFDCVSGSQFSFLGFPEYQVPVELKRNSAGFRYQQKKYGKDELSRAVVLCAVHNHQAVPANIDVVEFRAFSKYGRDMLSLDL